jgi:hypothetical protein
MKLTLSNTLAVGLLSLIAIPGAIVVMTILTILVILCLITLPIYILGKYLTGIWNPQNNGNN